MKTAAYWMLVALAAWMFVSEAALGDGETDAELRAPEGPRLQVARPVRERVEDPKSYLEPFVEFLRDHGGEPKEFLEISGGHNEGFIQSAERYEEGLNAFIGNIGAGKEN